MMRQLSNNIARGVIRLYQRLLSPDKGLLRSSSVSSTCVFTPTCSEYADEAIEQYGVVKGCVLSVKRICRCHPWQKERYDPVKE